LTPLLVAIALEPRRSRALLLGLLTGGVYFAGTLYWVVTVVATFGGLGMPVALGVGVLMVASLAIYPALFAWMAGRSIRAFGVAGVWLAPFLWVAAEWLRASTGFAFGWGTLGSSQARVLPIIQSASVVGLYGVSFIVALVASAAAAVSLSRRPVHLWGAIAVLASLALAAAAGAARVATGTLTTQGQPFRVGLVQGSVEQEVRENAAFHASIMSRHLDLSRQALAAGSDLVIWPESSTTFYFERDPVAAAPVRRLAEQTRTPFLVGSDEVERVADEVRYYNGAVLVGPDGISRGTYRKIRLVPFGEYVPLKQLLFFARPLVEAVSDFSPGTEPRVLDLGGGRKISVAICYESIYPWIGRAFVDRGTQLLAIITNDAWFGRSSAAYQHFEQGSIRAVEEGRYVVRAANTGISGAVDPYGRVLASTALFESTMLAVDVRLLTARTIYSRIGDVIVWISLVVAFGVVVASFKYNRRDDFRRTGSLVR
jgi:apolipoprotein N-acyltransferase